jgi:hypothetical protein
VQARLSRGFGGGYGRNFAAWVFPPNQGKTRFKSQRDFLKSRLEAIDKELES